MVVGAWLCLNLFGASSESPAAVRYVRSGNQPGEEYPYTSPETAAASIPSAMDAADYGDIVLVYPGVYGAYESQPYDIREGVWLVGSGPNRTVLMRDTLAAPNTLLSSFRVVDSIVRAPQGPVTVRDCLFDGSLILAQRGKITVVRCSFEGLWAERYCIEVTEGFGQRLSVQDCFFDLSDTTAKGAIMLVGGDPLSVTRCVFVGCQSAISLTEGRAEIMNCIFQNNGIGLHAGPCGAVVRNCTFYGNLWAVATAPGYFPRTFSNCVIWASTISTILEEDYGESAEIYPPAITFSNVEGGYAGQGNVDADPMFFLPSADEPDLHLCAFSPCVDAGDPFSDYSNEPEPNGGRINMGAYGGTWEATTSELVDTDRDNLRDDWEIEHFGTLDRDGMGDADGDSLSDREEYRHLTHPNDPDTDADTLSDGEEVSLGTSPHTADTDNDGTPDAKELAQGTDPLDWTDAFTVLDFYIEEGYLYITYPTNPGYEYSLYSSNWPNGPFGFTVSPYRGQYGVLTHTDVLRLGPYNRFFCIRARKYPGP